MRRRWPSRSSTGRSYSLGKARISTTRWPTRSNLLAALVRSPAALAVLHPGGERVLDDALSHDGRTLAVRADDGSVAFFDVRTLREVGERFHGSGQISYFGAIVRPVRALAFSPDDRTLAVGESTGTVAQVFLVDSRTHEARSSPTSSPNAVTADVAFAPDGRTFVTGEAVSGRFSPPDEVLVRRRAKDGAEQRRSRPIPGGRMVGFTRDGGSLLVTSGERRAVLLDARTFEEIRRFPVAGAPALSPTSDTAAFGHVDGNVVVVDLRTGVRRPMDRRATGGVEGASFSTDGTALATASDDGSVDVWDVPAGSLRRRFEGHAGAANSPVFSPDGATLYSGSSDGSVIVWDARGERALRRPFRFDPAAAAGDGPHSPAENAAKAVAVTSDNSRFATSPGPGRVTLWRASDQAVLGELRGPLSVIDSLAFSHDGRLLTATGDSRNTVVWNVATRKVVRVIGPAGEGGSLAVAISPDGRHLATAGVDGVLRVYDLRSGRAVGRGQVSNSWLDLDFSPDGTRVAAASLGGDLMVWKVETQTVEHLLQHSEGFLTIRFSPDGETFAAGDLAGNAQLWETSSGQRVGHTFGGHNGPVFSVSFGPSGAQLATVSGDGNLRLWDLASGKLLGEPLPGADTAGWGIFFPDGKHLIATFSDGTGVVWNLDPEAWKKQACRVAHRNLSREEWRDLLPGRSYRHVCS